MPIHILLPLSAAGGLASRILALAAWLLISPAVYAECLVTAGAGPIFTSSNGSTQIQLLSKGRILVTTADDSQPREQVLDPAHPWFTRTGEALNSGDLVLLSAWCGPMNLETTAVAVYRPDGQIRWKKSIRELLPTPGLFAAGIDHSAWFKNHQLKDADLASEAVLTVTLLNRDLLHINLATGDATHETVPNSALVNDPDAILSRAYSLGKKGGALQLLESAQQRFPAHQGIAYALSKTYRQQERYPEAIAVMTELTKHHPLPAAGEDERPAILLHQSPADQRRELVELYLAENRLQEAEAMAAEVYRLKPQATRIVRTYVDTLLRQEKLGPAKAVLSRLYNEKLAHYRDQPELASAFHGEMEEIARILLQYKLAQEAERFLDAPAKIDQNSKDSWYLTSRGKSYAKAGFTAKAATYYHRAVEFSTYGGPEYELAELYRHHPELAENHLEQSVLWYERTLQYERRKREMLPSQLALCYLYAIDRPAPADRQKSFHWCQATADNGQREGMFWNAIHLGDARQPYYDPQAARERLAQARDENYPGWGRRSKPAPYAFEPDILLQAHYRWAAEVLAGPAFSNDALGAYTLGHIYLSGYGVPADDASAEQWLTRSAELGYAPAMLALGDLYWRSSDYNNKSQFRKKQQTAFTWFEKAAMAGDEWGYYYMAKLQMGTALGKADLVGARSNLEQFSALYREKQQQRHAERLEKNAALYSKYGRPSLSFREPAADLYARLEKLEASAKRAEAPHAD